MKVCCHSLCGGRPFVCAFSGGIIDEYHRSVLVPVTCTKRIWCWAALFLHLRQLSLWSVSVALTPALPQALIGIGLPHALPAAGVCWRPPGLALGFAAPACPSVLFRDALDVL